MVNTALWVVVAYYLAIEKHIPNGERYSKLEVYKSIERNGKVIYFLGNEKIKLKFQRNIMTMRLKPTKRV